jgi:rubrerythrin
MPIIFDISEIYQIAIAVEENGIKFYSLWAEKTKNKKIRELFSTLAEMEVEHKKIFEKMLSEIKKYEPEGAYTEEYFLYLKAYVDGIIFNFDELRRQASKLKTISQALTYAIQREKDSILYYQEAKNIVPKHQADELEKIINEERRHLLDLSYIKKTL